MFYFVICHNRNLMYIGQTCTTLMKHPNNEHTETKFCRAPQFGKIPAHGQVGTNALTSGREKWRLHDRMVVYP